MRLWKFFNFGNENFELTISDLELFLKICLGDLSCEDLFRRFFLLWRCVHEDLFRRFFLLKMCSWRFVQEIFPFKDLFKRFFLLWRGVYEDLFRGFFLLKICSRYFSFENLFRRFFLLKMCSGDFSFYEDKFMKIFLRDFSFWRFF